MNDKPTLAQVLAGKKAVLFDLFHTLTPPESTWASTRPYTHQMLGVSREAWNRQLLECSRDRLAGIRTDPFKIIAGMARAIDPSIPDDLVRAAVDNRIARFAEGLMRIPRWNREVIATLKSRGKKIGLVSNADVMEAAGWARCPIADLFDSVVFSCACGAVKPEPEIYRYCLRQLGVEARDAVFVGDGGSNELDGARAVGLTPIMVAGVAREAWPEKIEERQKQADFVIEELRELV